MPPISAILNIYAFNIARKTVSLAAKRTLNSERKRITTGDWQKLNVQLNRNITQAG